MNQRIVYIRGMNLVQGRQRDFNLLPVAVAVADTGSVTAAAARL
jgi:hypothetical protein